MKRSRGFTLIEVMVAVAVFALAMALAYGGLNSIVQSRRQLDQEADALSRLQFAVGLLERDLRSAVDRPVQDRYGQRLPALALEGGRLALTRGGYANALAASRAELQRVDWRWRDGDLLRQSALQLDAADSPSDEPLVVLGDVDGLRIEALAADLRWTDRWPQLGQSAESMPRAVRVRFQHSKFGQIERIFEIAARPPVLAP
ncbi:type II secretion system minor pseudopilin GspJ [Pseudomarimonas arenosa]|uniref:Type II secretion system protein J n=1 Tax=Pseudomarimonas arenosa TaxID=2774145 RepID=A0AAW3ZHJ5_9GAMM|nr:type II secretion system minor pseudopilin GspJ [Pseudomarimonas arenosa]MBD8525558.1 type II secretion system minor pseudopilin GspJ [Pseudomarimonas arenosa]